MEEESMENKRLIQETIKWLSCPDSSESSDDAVSSCDDSWPSGWRCQDDSAGPTAAIQSEERRSANRKLCMAATVSLIFMTGELIGGYFAGSLAIMTDAAHLLTDFFSIVISIFSLWLSNRTHTDTMTYGWHRAEILGVLLSVVSIWAVTAVLVLSAVQRISSGDYDIDSRIMLVTSGCAVAVNVLMVLILHQSGASHGHSHTFPSGQRRHHGNCGHGNGGHGNGGHGNASVKAAFIHVLGDLVQSVGVLVAATIIHCWPEHKSADPVCTFLFSFLVLGTTFPVLNNVLRILMEAAPQGVDVAAVKKSLLNVIGVEDLHSLYVWSLNMNTTLLSVHLATEEDSDAQLIIVKATKLLRSEFGFSRVTIQVER